MKATDVVSMVRVTVTVVLSVVIFPLGGRTLTVWPVLMVPAVDV